MNGPDAYNEKRPPASRRTRKGPAPKGSRGVGPKPLPPKKVVHRLVGAALAVLAAVAIVVFVVPVLRVQFSGARPVIDTLSGSSVYTGPGAPPLDVAQVEGIIGTRPIGVIDLAGTDSLADHPLDTCESVVKHVPDILAIVIVDGDFKSGCEGSGVRFGSDTNAFGWDYVFWQQQSQVASMLDGDVAGITQALALSYDAEVKGGRLVGAERVFTATPNRTLLAAGITAAVVLGALAAFLALRLGTDRALRRAVLRRSWQSRRGDLDTRLSEVALRMIEVDARTQPDAATTIGTAAPEYLDMLQQLHAARPGDDLDALADRIAALDRHMVRP